MTDTATADAADPTEVEQAHPQITWNFRELIHSAQTYRQTLAKQLGINPSELIALGHVYKDGPITPNVLAQRLDFTTGSVTALVDRLEDAGLVFREDNPTDRRSKHLRTTEQGAKAMEDVYSDLDAAIAEATQGMSDSDITRFAGMMHSITARLDKHIETATT